MKLQTLTPSVKIVKGVMIFAALMTLGNCTKRASRAAKKEPSNKSTPTGDDNDRDRFRQPQPDATATSPNSLFNGNPGANPNSSTPTPSRTPSTPGTGGGSGGSGGQGGGGQQGGGQGGQGGSPGVPVEGPSMSFKIDEKGIVHMKWVDAKEVKAITNYSINWTGKGGSTLSPKVKVEFTKTTATAANCVIETDVPYGKETAAIGATCK